MEQAQFDQAVLQMAHQGGVQRLTPPAVAYQLRLSVKDAERMLDKMVTNALLELDSDDDGNLFYYVPGHGTPGVFTEGTSASMPVDSPKPDASYGAPASYGQPPAPAPAASYGQPPQQPYGAPHQQHTPQQHPQNPPYGNYAPPTQAPPAYGQPYGQPYPPQQGQAPYGQPPQQTPYSPYAPPQPQQQYGQQQQYAQPGYQAPVGQPYGQPGYPQQGQPYGQQQYNYGHNALVPVHSTPKSPGAASLLSAIIPGAGQLYNGQVGKGLTFFFVTCFLLAAPPLAVVPWLLGVVDAFNTSKQQNQRQQNYGLLGP